ncbi:MAG TPA: N-acetylmuramic acid 6-phosphate etherase, partial [Verrucomicrobiae bacterium]|nr:N-acetylmuramic acid 6-phosphate etherase [Verrucomicrobiae bacterium]
MAQNDSRRLLGIEGGGTRTLAVLANARGEELHRVEEGPANLRLLSDSALVRHLSALRRALPPPDSIAVGLAGAWTDFDRERIRKAAAKVWPGIPCHATNDLETAFNAGHTGTALPRVLVVSGTGSCCYGKTPAGREIKVGGWGHILGDKGSGYEIGLRALKAAVFYYDRDGVWPGLGRRILRALLLNEPNDLIGWAQAAGKHEIAGLAVEVFEAWKEKDKIAADILNAAAGSLARDAATCARRIGAQGGKVEFLLSGSILLRQPRFAALVGRNLKALWPARKITPLHRDSVWGAIELARKPPGDTVEKENPTPAKIEIPKPLVLSKGLSPTELRHPRSMRFDKLSVAEAVHLMLSEDATIPRKLMGEAEKIEKTVRFIVQAFRRKGRLFYIGAGTSGRLGVLDASECPPTFRTNPDLVQGIIAGGEPALRRSIEGAEDNVRAGARAMEFRSVGARDVVVGIAASGTTPFVWGGLREAKRRGAKTVLLCFNPRLQIPRALRPSVVIAPDLGPELLTGSTRLKAGTATKLALNIFTTVAMVRTGKVLSNL